MNFSERSKIAAGHAVNVLLCTLLAMVALIFAVQGYGYKSVRFIAENYSLLLWLTVSIISALYLLFIIFYTLEKQAIHRLLLCTFICLDIAAVLFWALNATGAIIRLTSIEELRNYISGFGATAVLIFIAFQFLQVVILPVPGSVSVAVGVALFGPLRCALFSIIGILLGSFTAFAIGRVVGYRAVCWIVGKEDLDKWLKKIRGKDYLILSIMFLLPLFPDDVLCFVAGLSSMTWPYFSVMIVITRLISVFSTSYSLGLIPFNTWWGIAIWIAIGALVVAAFWLVLKYSDEIDGFIKNKLKIGSKK